MRTAVGDGEEPVGALPQLEPGASARPAEHGADAGRPGGLSSEADHQPRRARHRQPAHQRERLAILRWVGGCDVTCS